MKSLIVAGLCVLVLASRAFAQSFEAPLILGPSWNAAVGDVNGDGLPDVLGAANSQIMVHLATTPGRFAPPLVYAVGQFPWEGEKLAVADFNGDRYADVALFTYASVEVFAGGADGLRRIGHVAFTNGQSNFGSIAAGDLNADGKVDLFVAEMGSSHTNLMSLVGDGRGGFSIASRHAGPSGMNTCYAAAFGDFDADGKTDVAAACQYWGVQVFLGHGDGTLEPPVRSSANLLAVDVAAGDIDRDGRTDLLVATWGPVHFWTLGTAARPLFGDDTSNVEVADFNRDGYLDAIGVSNGGGLHASYGDGRGGFTAVSDVPYGYLNTLELTIADMNLDGYPDLLTGGADGAFNGVMLFAPSTDDRVRAAAATLARLETSLNGVSTAIGALEGTGPGNLSALHAAVSSRASQASIDAMTAYLAGLDVPVSTRASAADVAALHGALAGVVDQAAAQARDAMLRVSIEQALARGERLSSLYLPEAFGGALERVREVVVDELDRNVAALLNVGRAPILLAKGDQKRDAQHYRAAFDAYAEAYQAIVK